MKAYYWTNKTTCPAGILVLLFSLLASISLTPSEFIDCQSLFPEENLDFLGICGASHQKQSHTCLSPFLSPRLPLRDIF